jgi:hypothetical protein
MPSHRGRRRFQGLDVRYRMFQRSRILTLAFQSSSRLRVSSWRSPDTVGQAWASPIFSSIWAIADQYNGSALGFAASAIAKLKPGEITDVVGTSALIPPILRGRSTTPTAQPSTQLWICSRARPRARLRHSFRAHFGRRTTTIFLMAFGVDTSLTVTPGWEQCNRLR